MMMEAIQQAGINEEQRGRFCKLYRLLIDFTILDVAIVLFVSFGLVFPSKMTPRNPDDAMPESFYDYSAKVSPLTIPQHGTPNGPKHVIPVFSARGLPLPSAMPGVSTQVLPVGYGNVTVSPVVSPAPTEANLTAPRRTT